MEHQEITLGQVTYQISQIYTGSRPAAELVLERLTQNLPAGHPVDGDPDKGLYGGGDRLHQDLQQNDISNILLLLKNENIIGIMIWHSELLHFLMVETHYHGKGAAQYFCDAVIPDKLKEFGELRLECFDKNERANSFYKKQDG